LGKKKYEYSRGVNIKIKRFVVKLVLIRLNNIYNNYILKKYDYYNIK
jgi:hypothetical protein